MKHKNASSQFFPSGLKDIVPKVINYCKRELDIPEHILISVEYEDLSEEGVKGWAIDSPEKDEYDIEIDCNLGIDESLLTICHEMVHVSQMYREDKLDEGEAEKKEKILYDGYVEKFSTTTPSKMTTNEYVNYCKMVGLDPEPIRNKIIENVDMSYTQKQKFKIKDEGITL